MTKKQEKELTSLLRKAMLLRDGGCVVKKHTKGIPPKYLECGGPLQMSHIYTKAKYKKLKWAIDNVFTACQRHHLYTWHQEPAIMGKWIWNVYPNRMKRLTRRANKIEKMRYDKVFYEYTKKELQAEIDKYEVDFAKL